MIDTLPSSFSGLGPRPQGLLFVLLALALIESLLLRRAGKPGYDWRESAASTAIAIGNVVIRPLSAALLTPVFVWASAHRLLAIDPKGLWAFLLLFIAVDASYYFWHRSWHRLRFFWATHSVHHSTTRFNLSAAYRLAWTDLLGGAWLFLLAFVWLGMPPMWVIGAFALNLTYQFFLHTESVGKLGAAEWLFNTPNHHRVHHACNEQLHDKNFGGVLIIWDRLFGTFAKAPANEPIRYGIANAPISYNPLRIALREWGLLLRDLWKARTAATAWRTLVRID